MRRVIRHLHKLTSPEHGGPWARRLGYALTGVGVVLVAATAAEVTWRLLVPGKSLPQAEGVAAQEVAPRLEADEGRSGPGLAGVAEHHLFGRPPGEADEQPVRKVPVDAPETRLDLALKGVLAVGGKGRGTAIIAEDDETAVYVAGAELPGGAVLERVHADRVILSRDGSFERLGLDREAVQLAQGGTTLGPAEPGEPPVRRGDQRSAEITDVEPYRGEGKDTATRGERPEASGGGPDDADGAIERRELTRLRDQFQEDPGKITRMVGVQPVMDGGRIGGFRITPHTDQGQRYLEQAGLQEGDVVTAVDGVAVNDREGLSRLVQKLDTASEVRLSIKRNERKRDLVVRLE